MKIAVFPETCAIAGRPVMQAFIESLKGENYVICKNNDRPDADVIVIWSVLLNLYGRKPIYEYYKSQNKKILVLEVGGLARNKSWRIGLNGINAIADFANTDADDNRLSKFNLDLKPWRKSGDYIVICTQNENSEAWTVGPTSSWVEQKVQWIRSQTDRKILLRPHPRFKVNFNHVLLTYTDVELCMPKYIGKDDLVDFTQVLQNAHAVVNFNSNPAIESVIEGIPVYVDDTSLCRSVGNPIGGDIENPSMPDRTVWRNKLTYCEWFIEEIKQGIPWKRMKQSLING